MIDKVSLAPSNALSSTVSDLQLQEQRHKFEEQGDDGFFSGIAQSAIHAWENPGETAAKVGGGLAIGALIQTGLNNAEMVGGKVGTAAKLAKVALLAIPAALTAKEVVTSDTPFETAGKMTFDMGLFLGASKVGTYADRVPKIGTVFGPRPTSHVPERLKFQVRGDEVHVNTRGVEYGTHQVRLANGKGFIFKSNDTVVPLREMPLHIPGKGQIEYGPNATVLHTESGGRFVRTLGRGYVSSKSDEGILHTVDGKSFNMNRTVDGRKEDITWHGNGAVDVRQGSYQSGRDWSFKEDGSASMRSLPHGKYRMQFGPDGEGTYTYTHGTSRGIAGLVGPVSRYSPLKRDVTPMNIKDAPTPDISLPSLESRTALLDAKRVLDALAGKQV